MTGTGPAVAELLAARVLAAPARLGGTRLVCVDGPSGSGKTTLTGLLVARLQELGCSVAVVGMDDVYDGWEGLPDAGRRVAEGVVAPLAEGRPGCYRRYDWHAGRLDGPVVVPATDVLVVEGVGAADPAYSSSTSLTVWVDAPREVRHRRALARDGERLRPQLERWWAVEEELLARHRTRERADVRVEDGVTGAAARRRDGPPRGA